MDLLGERDADAWPLDRDPLLLETSVPGIFAAGDVRHGSIERVASSVGAGSPRKGRTPSAAAGAVVRSGRRVSLADCAGWCASSRGGVLARDAGKPDPRCGSSSTAWTRRDGAARLRTPTAPLAVRDDLLTPIPGDNPAGVDLRYELYDIVREARREEIDVPTGGWDHPRKTADWDLVAKETSQALATRSKDIQLAVWLVEATYHRESFEGFAAAVRMTAQLLERFWDHLYPELEDGDPEARIAPLEWLGSDKHPLCRAIRLAPITANGLTIFEFRDARAVGFELAVNATPKAWYQQRSADLAAALDALGMLDRVGAEKFGRDAPGYSELRKSIEEVQAVILELLGRKLTREPDPVDAAELPSGTVDARPPATKPSLEDAPGEDVRFTVYRPAVVQPAEWYPLLAFAHKADGAPDSDGRDPEAAVAHQAAQVLEGRINEFRRLIQDSSYALPREGTITFVPAIPGFEFNPPRRSFQWRESVHREEFRLRASSHLDGQTARGTMTVYHGVIILAEMALTIRVDSSHRGDAAETSQKHVQASPFRKIFASYSHRDLEIVRQFERYAAGVGDRYLRDLTELRAGEDWNDRLLELIRDADILQLFWSWNALSSRFVRQEWEYALSLERANFIRPTYWEDPMPSTPDGTLPPDALRRLHFQKIALSPWRTVHPTATTCCANCGADVAEGARFCARCGMLLVTEVMPAPSAGAQTARPRLDDGPVPTRQWEVPRVARSSPSAADVAPVPEIPASRAASSAPVPAGGRRVAAIVALLVAILGLVGIVWLVARAIKT